MIGFGSVLDDVRGQSTSAARERADASDDQRHEETRAQRAADERRREDAKQRGADRPSAAPQTPAQQKARQAAARARKTARAPGRGRGGVQAGGTGALVDGVRRHGLAPPLPPQRSTGAVPGEALLADSLDPGTVMARQMGAVETVAQLEADSTWRAEISPHRALREGVDHPPLGAGASAYLQESTGGAAKRMTPRAALDMVVDEATRLAIDEASKELHIELEPADLGPLIITLRRDGKRLDVRMTAARAAAAHDLADGQRDLEDRLGRLGYAAVRVTVEHDELRF